MKKITCMILSILMILSGTMPVLADKNADAITEEYKSIPVQYSDKTGQTEYLEVMIKDENVYVNARKLAERFGYQLNDSHDEYVSVYNKENQNLPYGITRFYYNDTKVEHLLFTVMYDNYKAPFASVKNDKGIWIPLEYSLLILNSGMMIADNTILIDMPEKSIMDIYMDVLKNNDKYMFGWEKDFGYSDSYQEVMGTISHNINFLNGVITSDGDTWLQMLQTAACSKECALDAKYGEKISMLLCTESDKELKAVTSDVKKCMDLLDSRGKVGKLLSKYSESLDNDVENLYKQCDAILSDMKKGNSDAAKYNRSYQALQKALDKQTWFSESGGKILEVQKGVTEAFPYLEVGLKVAEVVKYADEFENQDKFTVEALTNYLNSSTGRSISSESVIKSMKSYTKDLQSNIFQYSAKRVFDENIMGWLKKGSKECVGDLIGTQANIELIAWSLAANYVPFISNGLEASEDYQLAMYSSIFQADTFLNYQKQRNKLFNDRRKITSDELYSLSQYCYVYLKSCYITRDAAVGSLKGKNDSIKKKIQPLIDYQNGINEEIAKMLIKLKDANKGNDKLVYGFLPEDNDEYLEKYDEIQKSVLNFDSVDDSWKKAYIDYINSNGDKERTWCQLIYINDDEIPELIVDYGSVAEGQDLCTFYDSQVQHVHIRGDSCVQYYERENLFCVSGGRMDGYDDIVFRMNEGNIEKLYEGSFGAKDNSNVQFDEYGYPVYEYYWQGEEVSREEYKEELNSVFDVEKSKTPDYENMVTINEMIKIIQNMS